MISLCPLIKVHLLYFEQNLLDYLKVFLRCLHPHKHLWNCEEIEVIDLLIAFFVYQVNYLILNISLVAVFLLYCLSNSFKISHGVCGMLLRQLAQGIHDEFFFSHLFFINCKLFIILQLCFSDLFRCCFKHVQIGIELSSNRLYLFIKFNLSKKLSLILFQVRCFT